MGDTFSEGYSDEVPVHAVLVGAGWSLKRQDAWSAMFWAAASMISIWVMMLCRRWRACGEL